MNKIMKPSSLWVREATNTTPKVPGIIAPLKDKEGIFTCKQVTFAQKKGANLPPHRAP